MGKLNTGLLCDIGKGDCRDFDGRGLAFLGQNCLRFLLDKFLLFGSVEGIDSPTDKGHGGDQPKGSPKHPADDRIVLGILERGSRAVGVLRSPALDVPF